MSNNWLANGATAVPWYDDPKTSATMRQMKNLYDFSLTLADRKPSAQIMVLVDPKIVFYQDPLVEPVSLGTTLMYQFRQQVLERIGAPYDCYMTDDLDRLEQKGLLAQYRLIIFLNQFHLTEAERAFIKNKLMKDGRTIFWIYAPGYVRDINVAGPDATPTGLSTANIAELIDVSQVGVLKESHGTFLCLNNAEPGNAATIPAGKWGPVFWVPAGAAIDGPQVERQALGWLALDGKMDRTKAGLVDVRRMNDTGNLQYRSIYCAIPNFRPALMRKLAREAGVHIYLNADELLFADHNWVLLGSGERPIKTSLALPERKEVYDVFQDALLGLRETVDIDIPPFTTRLYYLGDSGKLRGRP